MLDTDSADQLAAIFDQFSVPMFAAERASVQSEFKIVCINQAHAEATGFEPITLRDTAVRDLLPRTEADFAIGRYAECARTQNSLRYLETLTLPDGVQQWDTSIQPVQLAGGGDRVIGTTFKIADAENTNGAQMTYDNIRYFSALADMQLQNLLSMFEIARVQGLFNTDSAGRVHRLCGICRSVQRSVEDIRETVRRASPDPTQRKIERTPDNDAADGQTLRAIYQTARDMA